MKINHRSQNINSAKKEIEDSEWTITRRFFLKSAILATTSLCAGIGSAYSNNKNRLIKQRFGIVTDSHYADIDSRNNRYYRESIHKMNECVELMNEKKVDFLIHLGDFINGSPEKNIDNLKDFESIYSKFHGPRYHVLGNHDMDSISKNQFQSVVENTDIEKDATHYSFIKKGVQFIVMDANFRNDGISYDNGNFSWTDSNVPKTQVEWLKKKVDESKLPVIIFIHQPIDSDEGSHYIGNAAEVRNVLESSNKVLAVFQGHLHTGDYTNINDIHYYTLKAMVEGSGGDNNSYALVELYDDYSMEVIGYRKSISHYFERK